MEKNNLVNESNDLLHAQAELWDQIFSFLKSMSLKCAVELGIPDAIHNHGKPITLPKLHSILSLPPSKIPHLSRLLRMLTHSGVLTEKKQDANGEAVYDLTPMSQLLVTNFTPSTLSPFLQAMLAIDFVKPTLYISNWFKQDKQTPFEMMHGCSVWEFTAREPDFNDLFNRAMASDSCFLMDIIVKECHEVFTGIDSLVDVGGGNGSVAMAIAKAFPQVKCTVLDLPQVVGHLPKSSTVNFVTGDMFQYIPPADAVLLKWIMHDWNNEECVEILRRCREAITSQGTPGKVIIVDMVVGSTSSELISKEPQLFLDMFMMALLTGTERDEHEWQKLFKEAGFSCYKISPVLGLRSVIEVYP